VRDLDTDCWAGQAEGRRNHLRLDWKGLIHQVGRHLGHRRLRDVEEESLMSEAGAIGGEGLGGSLSVGVEGMIAVGGELASLQFQTRDHRKS
jgi:hypothetical protein